MNIKEQADKQVADAEKTYFNQLDLVAELLGHPHPSDPRVREKDKVSS